MIQSTRGAPTRKKRSPVLFLVDIDTTVDDAADRYYKLCKEAGLELSIIRMYGGLGDMSSNDEKLEYGDADYTNRFLTAASLAQHVSRNPDKAPTLDEAALDYYERHKSDSFPELQELILIMDTGAPLSTADLIFPGEKVNMIYYTVVRQADFIATTPVAAYGRFSQLFRPDIIFIDEASHARELTTLIPIAYFNPLVWIFTGDVKQTRPFIRGGRPREMERQGLTNNPFGDQMQFSTMARAEAVGAINIHLLVNKRAYGSLHRLPSKLFYNGDMSSGHRSGKRHPLNTMYMKDYLEDLGGQKDPRENRVVVQLSRSREEKHRRSFWNPIHHKWIIKEVERLLEDPKFRSATSNDPGTIMVPTPYSTSYRKYPTYSKKWPEDWRKRVRNLTIDKAQGNQAEVVFLDMVRTSKPGFMDNPPRLNVAITRARQAEIIVMHRQMTTHRVGGQVYLTRYISQIWDDAWSDGRLLCP